MFTKIPPRYQKRYKYLSWNNFKWLYLRKLSDCGETMGPKKTGYRCASTSAIKLSEILDIFGPQINLNKKKIFPELKLQIGSLFSFHFFFLYCVASFARPQRLSSSTKIPAMIQTRRSSARPIRMCREMSAKPSHKNLKISVRWVFLFPFRHHPFQYRISTKYWNCCCFFFFFLLSSRTLCVVCFICICSHDWITQPSYRQYLEFALKLGYSERLVQLALGRLGSPTNNELLAELIKLGAQPGSNGT